MGLQCRVHLHLSNHLFPDQCHEGYLQKLKGKGKSSIQEPELSETQAYERFVRRLKGKGTKNDSVASASLSTSAPHGIRTDDQGRTFHTDDSTHREQAYQDFLARQKSNKKKTGLLENVPTHEPDPSEPQIIGRGIYIPL